LDCNLLDCNDNIDCTLDFCVDGIGCINTPDDSFCSSNDPCLVPKCELGVGCVQTPMSCHDENPCTIDSCVGGQCVHSPNTALCNDNLRCTDDICVPDPQDPERFSCNSVVDPSNCGPVPSCVTTLCAVGHDCELVLHDDRCPSIATCLAPVCTPTGCGLRDLCGSSNPQCNGCADCACNMTLNRCVQSCPS
jgi:hypothetical protein